MSRVATSSFYAQASAYELSIPEGMHMRMKDSLRGHLLLNDVRSLNKQELIPHILDLGPGEYWTPMLLKESGLLFTYEPAYINFPSFDHYRSKFESNLVNYKSELKAKSPNDPTRPTILFACEIIEHLWNENEIRHEMERYIGCADIVHISTPNMTFDYECTDWKSKNDLGHLRAYTPDEFNLKVFNMFPDYNVHTLISQILHSRLTYKNSAFQTIKDSKVVI